jgi:hemerythrin
MNRLHDLYEAAVTGPKIVKVLAELGDVTVKHFAHEQAYL